VFGGGLKRLRKIGSKSSHYCSGHFEKVASTIENAGAFSIALYMTDDVTAAALASEDGTDAVPTEMSWDLVALGLLRCFQRGAELSDKGMKCLQLIVLRVYASNSYTDCRVRLHLRSFFS
jgi:hypothetical protein